jgi:hypothetical protein
MQRMLTQIGTPQDNQQLQNQLWVFLLPTSIRSILSVLVLLAYESIMVLHMVEAELCSYIERKKDSDH